jgi:hypothetical protein
MDNLLWKHNGTKPPLQVVLEPSHRLQLTSEAHDKSGHRGKDPSALTGLKYQLSQPTSEVQCRCLLTSPGEGRPKDG